MTARQLRLPYWTMAGEEFRDLVIGKSEWEATSEHNIVYKALVHARLAQRGLVQKSQNWQGKSAVGVSDPLTRGLSTMRWRHNQRFFNTTAIPPTRSRSTSLRTTSRRSKRSG